VGLCCSHVAVGRIERRCNARVPQAVGTRPDACQIA